MDTAFLGLLSSFNLSITQALGLRSQLAALLLYHLVPGARSAPDLEATAPATLPTLLGQTTGGDYELRTDMAPLAVAAQAPGSRATVLRSLTVCGTAVHVIDKARRGARARTRVCVWRRAATATPLAYPFTRAPCPCRCPRAC